jgi:hypothetical protein
MARKTASVEGMKHRRFKVPRDALVALRSDFFRVGQLERIGLNGLEFRYIAAHGPIDEPFELDVFLSGSPFYLYKLPFRIISDSQADSDTSFQASPMRQCAVQFSELTSHQKHMLQYFIENHTIGES